MIVWALVAASAAFWGLHLFAASRALPAEARVPSRPVAVNSPMTRLFGALPEAAAAATQSPESDRFQLQGVIAEGARGLAIVSIDGQAPRAWRVGTPVEGDTLLLSVSKRSADFGPRGGPSAFTLELPAPTAAATGTLPGATNNPQGAPRPANVGAINPNTVRSGGPVMPGVNAPGYLNRGPNGVTVMPPRAMPQQQPPMQQQGDGGQVQRDEE